jgi:CheY-like chemotaxis protein
MATKIVICEDNNIIALDLKTELGKWGYKNSVTLNSGEELIEHARKQIPELIIMDTRLGGKIKGQEALKTILTKKSLPIILLDGDRELIDLELTGKPNVSVIKKPLIMKELKKLLDKLIKNNPN